MHPDIFLTQDVLKPNGKICVVYFSSSSGNTYRFVKKLDADSHRIPEELDKTINVDQDFVLISPTYSGGGDKVEGAVPKQIIKFLNVKSNRENCKGVIGTGNTNFSDTFALAGIIISQKLNIPLLYQLELSGTMKNVLDTQKILNNFWQKDDINKTFMTPIKNNTNKEKEL